MKNLLTTVFILKFGHFQLVGPQQEAANKSHPRWWRAQCVRRALYGANRPHCCRSREQFGFRYKITGVSEDGSADFKMVVKHPPLKKEREIEREYTTKEALPAKNGFVSEVTVIAWTVPARSRRLGVRDLVPRPETSLSIVHCIRPAKAPADLKAPSDRK
jgi:hypothetical protein